MFSTESLVCSIQNNHVGYHSASRSLPSADRGPEILVLSIPCLQYLRFAILLAAGWINRDQEKIIDYLLEEMRVYRKHLKGAFGSDSPTSSGVDWPQRARHWDGRPSSNSPESSPWTRFLSWFRNLVARTIRRLCQARSRAAQDARQHLRYYSPNGEGESILGIHSNQGFPAQSRDHREPKHGETHSQ